MKNLLNRLFTFLAKATTPKAPIIKTEKVNNITVPVKENSKQKVAELYSKTKPDYEHMNWKEVPQEIKLVWRLDVQDEAYDDYKKLPSILNKYRTEFIQEFVIGELVQLGQYHPEEDNIEGRTKEELLEDCIVLQEEIICKRMQDKGKSIEVTEGQKKVLIKNGYTEEKIANMTKLSASRAIDLIMQSVSDKPTAPQIYLLHKLCTELGESMPTGYTTKEEVSALISQKKELMAKNGVTLEVKLCSDNQITYIKRLLPQVHHRITAKLEAELRAKNSQEVSKYIKELEDEADKLHPELTKGQLEYIISNMQMLNMPYDIETLKVMTKKDASKLIDKLRRDYLFVITRLSSPSLTRSAIEEMTSDGVKEMISHIKEEKTTKNYTSDDEGKSDRDSEDEIPF